MEKRRSTIKLTWSMLLIVSKPIRVEQLVAALGRSQARTQEA
jgi:hypothetical protein